MTESAVVAIGRLPGGRPDDGAPDSPEDHLDRLQGLRKDQDNKG